MKPARPSTGRGKSRRNSLRSSAGSKALEGVTGFLIAQLKHDMISIPQAPSTDLVERPVFGNTSKCVYPETEQSCTIASEEVYG